MNAADAAGGEDLERGLDMWKGRWRGEGEGEGGEGRGGRERRGGAERIYIFPLHYFFVFLLLFSYIML